MKKIGRAPRAARSAARKFRLAPNHPMRLSSKNTCGVDSAPIRRLLSRYACIFVWYQPLSTNSQFQNVDFEGLYILPGSMHFLPQGRCPGADLGPFGPIIEVPTPWGYIKTLHFGPAERTGRAARGMDPPCHGCSGRIG